MASSDARKQRRQHALAIPMLGQGHVNPLMRLCKRLASQEGFTITFVTIELHHPHHHPLHHHHYQQQQQQQQQEEARKLDIRRACIPLLLPDLSGSTTMMEGFFGAMQGLAPQIEELVLRMRQQEEDPPLTCLISDLFMTGATQSVADRFKLPRIALNPCSQSVIVLLHHILQGAISLEEVVKVTNQRELLKDNIFKEGLQGLPTLKVGDLVENLGENHFCYKFMSQALEETTRRAHALVVNSLDEIEGNALEVNIGLPVYAIGPLVEPLEKETSTSLWKEDDACMSWLDEQPRSSVLFISFGSFASLSIAQFEELVAGLLSSQQRFLWVFRQGLVKDAPYTTFPEEMLSSSNGKGYATPWAPQVKVLAHRSIHGFLTHCGWNSTVEALSKGVPMLCFPYVADQFMDAKLVVEQWKLGLCFEENKETKLVGREEVERVIKALMEGEEGKLLHKNAKYFREACEQSCLEGGNGFENVKALVKSIEQES